MTDPDINPELPDYAQPQKGTEADESTETAADTETAESMESSRSTETADDPDPLEEGDFPVLT